MPRQSDPPLISAAPQPPSFLERSRLSGELTIAWFRIGVGPLAAVATLMWTMLDGVGPDVLSEPALWVQAAYFGMSAVLLWFTRRRAHTDRVGYIAPIVDVVMLVTTLSVWAAGPDATARAGLARGLMPTVCVACNLLSVARHDPWNCLFCGSLTLAGDIVLRGLTGGVIQPEPVGGMLGLVAIAASAAAAWIVSVQGLGLAEKTVQAERTLQREQLYQFRLFDSTTEAVVQLTPQSQIMRVNAAFTRLFGYAPEEAVGRDMDDLIVPDGLRDEASVFARQTGSGESLHAETVRRRKDGGLVDVSVIGVPVFLEGRQVAIFGVFRDITERRRKERFLEALNRASLRMLLAGTDGQAFDAAAGELGNLGLTSILFRLANDEEHLRLTQIHAPERAVRDRVESALGRSVVGLEVPAEPGSVYGRLLAAPDPTYTATDADALRALFAVSGEKAAVLGRVQATDALISACLPGSGGPAGLLVVLGKDLVPADAAAVGAFAHQLAAALAKVSLIQQLERNLEELRLIQAQLLQSQKLEAVGRLAGGVAHDFNNLLTVITGYGEVVRHSLPEGDRRRDEMGEILRAASRAADVTRQLLAFSRRQVLKVEYLDPNRVVDGLRNALLRLMGEHITLVVDTRPGIPRVRCDSTQMTQALLNIALNARDAMLAEGTLTMRCRVAEADQELLREHPEMRPGRYVRISLADTGSGIAPDVLPHIFEPFFTTKEAGQGTGLGLAMVYGFVKQSNGYVYAENQPEGGALFSIYLPAAQETETVPDDTPESDWNGDPQGVEGIVVVEDELPVLELTSSVLKRAGYGVISLSGPVQALALTPRVLSSVSLLVTDVVMPGMNGHALAQELVKRKAGLRVLYVSGYADDLFSRLGVRIDRRSMLQKPYTPADLLRRVREILDLPEPSDSDSRRVTQI